MKRKGFYSIIAVMFFCGFMAFSIFNAGQVSAKASAIIVITSDGSKYEYDYNELKQSAISNAMGDTVGGALYNHFMKNKISLEAYFDDTRNVYVPNSAIQSEVLSKVLNNLTFDFASFMENSSTPTETLSTSKFKNESGVVVQVGSLTGFDLDNIN